MVVRRKTNNDSELYHHGIKGQRWGVRRYQNYDGTKIGSSGNKGNGSEKKSKPSSGAKKKIAIALAAVAGLTIAGAATYIGLKYAKKPNLSNLSNQLGRLKNSNLAQKVSSRNNASKVASSLTDDELKSGIARLKLEREYKNLANESLHRSAIKLDDTVNSVANATIYTLMAGVTGYALRSSITGENDKELLADYVAPAPKQDPRAVKKDKEKKDKK